MGVSKIKNLVIAALILVNVFFLAIIIHDRAGDAARERQALEDACDILARAGVELDPGDVRARPGLRAMRTVRDISAQRAIAQAVLGEVTETEQGGILYQYDNAQTGVASFKSGGEFTITVYEDAYAPTSDVTALARGLTRDMGIEPSGFTTADENGGVTVTALCAHNGARIFNCFISFRFAGGSLRTVSGKYVSGITETEGAEAISSPATALMAFLTRIKKGEIVCEQIDAVTAGYFARDATAFGDGSLAPAWLIETDSGRYVVDASAGEILLMPG